MSEIPQDLRYTKEHEWARKEGELLVVGITAHAVDKLGDITMVTLPDPGASFDEGDAFGDVDSVKAVSELYAPIKGEIVECNTALEETPELINDEPYKGGWMVKIKPSDPAAFDGLMDAKAYTELADADG